jgi:hypothetical protein
MARPLLEPRIARRVAALPNVTVRHEACARVWLTDGEHRVTGVRVAAAGRGDETDLDADLVLDATGRGSCTPERLAAFGFDAPEAELLPPASPTRAACSSGGLVSRRVGVPWS